MVKKLCGALLVLMVLSSALAQIWEYATYSHISTRVGPIASDIHSWDAATGAATVEASENGILELHRELAGPDAQPGLIALLNYFGSQGWELVSIESEVTETASGRIQVQRYFFKRTTQ